MLLEVSFDLLIIYPGKRHQSLTVKAHQMLLELRLRVLSSKLVTYLFKFLGFQIILDAIYVHKLVSSH